MISKVKRYSNFCDFSYRLAITLFLTFAILSSLFTGSFYSARQATAQNATSVIPLSSMDEIKILVNDAIQSLKSGDADAVLIHLNLVKQQLSSSTAGHKPPIAQSIGVLVNDTIHSLQNGDTNTTLVHLNLIQQRIICQHRPHLQPIPQVQ